MTVNTIYRSQKRGDAATLPDKHDSTIKLREARRVKHVVMFGGEVGGEIRQ